MCSSIYMTVPEIMKPCNIDTMTRWLPMCIFAAYFFGVLISPPAAIHGLNHDYHAVVKKSIVVDSCSMRVQDGRYFHAAVLRCYSGTRNYISRNCGSIPLVIIRLRILIETWRLLLWPG